MFGNGSPMSWTGQKIVKFVNTAVIVSENDESYLSFVSIKKAKHCTIPWTQHSSVVLFSSFNWIIICITYNIFFFQKVNYSDLACLVLILLNTWIKETYFIICMKCNRKVINDCFQNLSFTNHNMNFMCLWWNSNNTISIIFFISEIW